ncbi:MAG: hypothetical protein AB9M53_04875 [Leptothrix sp. (in: b-proteobacteria)]
MALQQATKDLLVFLRTHPDLRSRIRARPNATLLYAGAFFRPIWKEILAHKQSDSQLASKQILPEVLITLSAPGMPHANLLDWAQAIDTLQPWQQNGFIVWRAVSFSIGSPISVGNKVFAATEVGVLARNPNVDAITKELVGYFQCCLSAREVAINFGFLAG